MENRTLLIINDFLNETLYKDKDDPFIDQKELKRNLERYLFLYKDFEEKFATFFSYFHYKLNWLFEFWNYKYRRGGGGHFNADQSRDLISLIEKYKEICLELKKGEDEIVTSESYLKIIDKIYPLLNESGGSPIPEEFGKIDIVKHDPVFILKKSSVKMKYKNELYGLSLIGEGSYAIIKKYFDRNYEKWFAIKQAKSELSDKELDRFKKEYKILKKISFPYILEVYGFNDENNSYVMEFCDQSLKEYISFNNQKLSFLLRKKIALQFLYGVNFLYKNKYFHRDLSWNNVLIKKYDYEAICVKISDFGLIRDENSDISNTDTSGKGSTFHSDPLLESFKEVKIENEIYSVGCVLNFIFTGKQNLTRVSNNKALSDVIDKCTDNRSLNNRYHDILSIINDIKKID